MLHHHFSRRHGNPSPRKMINVSLRAGKFFQRLSILRDSLFSIMAWPIAATFLALAGWGALLTHFEQTKQRTQTTLLAQITALSRSYADHVERAVESVDQTLRHTRFEWEITEGKLVLDEIDQRKPSLPSHVATLSIADQDGYISTGTHRESEKVYVGDRSYFIAQSLTALDHLFISPPVFARPTKQYLIPFSRPLINSSGGFKGVVIASSIPAYFTANYDSTTFGEYGLLAVAGTDNILRVSRSGRVVHTPDTPIFLHLPQFESQSGAKLLNGQEWFTDQRSRFVGWQTVKGYPLIAMTAFDQSTAMAGYWTDRIAVIRTAVIATIILAVFTMVAMLLSARIAWGKHQFQLVQATYRMATEKGGEGFFIARPVRDQYEVIVDFEIIDCNQGGASLFTMQPRELIGKSVSMLYSGFERDRLMRRLRRAMRTGHYEGEVQATATDSGDLRWLFLRLARSNNDLAITVRDITEAKTHIKELERIGNEDALTGLPNRHWAQSFLPQAISRAESNQKLLAILFVDLDRFKQINDTEGHSTGDELLKHSAHRLKLAVRQHDHVVRLGGDEFVVILENIAGKSDVAPITERALHVFEESFRLPRGAYRVSASVGVSIYPADGKDAQTLLKNADIAMYAVKKSGKGHYRFYEEKLFEDLRDRLEWEVELRHAIEQDQLIVYYQPRIDISSGQTSSMEALVRWGHPARGIVGPNEFIALAEETGLVLPLGERVIEKVCAQLATWRRSERGLLPVSINVSPRQLNENDIPGILATCLARYQLDAHLIEIEVTETSMMPDSPHVLKAITAIQNMGIKMCIDDFGTGYSSLSQLQQMDFDVLKVDRSFTMKIEKMEHGKVFFQAIITMAHALGMRVVAEGVENMEQITILKALCCDEIQGFFVSEPLPPGELQPTPSFNFS
jgi:diguanylate cyclase (GGDEF)-like protein/PAS domain S-box-containing protein